jgi:hypothetical protein
MAGYPTQRMLRNSSSCRWCGVNLKLKAAKADHEERCERRGSFWPFASAERTYYRDLKSEDFVECLRLARKELLREAMGEVAWILRSAGPAAALELRRQVETAERAVDRRQAAIAILDRLDLVDPEETKGRDGWLEWLEEMRRLDDEEDEDDMSDDDGYWSFRLGAGP